MSVLIFFIILIVLVVVHELGHFLVAKWSGIEVKEFGLGFPPRIIGKMWRGTLYSLNWIPFGGFVKIFGENPEEVAVTEEEKKKNFSYKPRPIQALVLIAGISFNILFAWFLISIGFMTGFPSSVGDTANGAISNPQIVITEVVKDFPAEKAGLQVGDKIVALEASSQRIDNLTPEDVQNFIGSHGGDSIKVQYERGNETGLLSVTPRTDSALNKGVIGISMDMIGTLKLPFFSALYEGAKLTGYVIKAVAIGLARFVWSAVTLNAHFSEVTGPVGIISLVGSAEKLGFVYLLSFAAFISLNLAVINLIPFPALDGGRLLFVLIESIKRSPIKPKVANMINSIGFAILIVLMVVVTLHDIVKIL
ncbi:MAG: RIP metalloprotease RseP [Candidatus Pacebacteria bacterium]|nr:RIP metalloprotease RseP [Candidatus Paceibacterota bacterium]